MGRAAAVGDGGAAGIIDHRTCCIGCSRARTGLTYGRAVVIVRVLARTEVELALASSAHRLHESVTLAMVVRTATVGDGSAAGIIDHRTDGVGGTSACTVLTYGRAVVVVRVLARAEVEHTRTL